MKMITFIDVLNVERELKTCIDLKSQLSGEPCWEVLTRATRAGSEGWHPLPRLNGKLFATEEEAYQAMVDYVNDLIQKGDKLGKRVLVSW